MGLKVYQTKKWLKLIALNMYLFWSCYQLRITTEITLKIWFWKNKKKTCWTNRFLIVNKYERVWTISNEFSASAGRIKKNNRREPSKSLIVIFLIYFSAYKCITQLFSYIKVLKIVFKTEKFPTKAEHEEIGQKHILLKKLFELLPRVLQIANNFYTIYSATKGIPKNRLKKIF